MSVIIPAYNCHNTIVRALDGVLNQTHKPIEILVIDDGSTDSTVKVVKSYGHHDMIKLIRIDNGGPAKARNIGIDSAKGDWFAFLDADDIWISNEKLAQQIEVVVKNPEAVLIDTYAEIFLHRKQATKSEKITKHGHVFSDFLERNIINATSSVLAKASAVKAIGGFKVGLNFGEDRLLWAKIAQMGTVHTVEKLCVYKENHINNLTSKGMSNLKHRVELVEELFTLTTLSENEKKRLWFVNLEDFALGALRAKSFSYFIAVSNIAIDKTRKRFFFSKYSIIYVACLLYSKVSLYCKKAFSR